MSDDTSTHPIPEGGRPGANPSSLKGLTMALGIEPAEPGHDHLLGCDIGGVTIVRLIAEGGMGRVYEGKQEKPNRTVAVKVMRPGLTSPSMLKRFEYEAEVLGRLQHPGIAHIYSVGVHRMGNASVPYFIMEYIADARTLTTYAVDLKLPTRQRMDLFRSVCDAVAHGHQKGVIHRDLKPSNILVDATGQPKVIDFGVARATDSDMALTTMQTDVGQLIGTLQYMSPEQFKADPNDIDVRSDVYALGVILYELVTGKMPYDVKKKAIHEVARIVQEDDPTPLSSFNRALKGDVAVIAGKCLEKNRAHRYSSASELGSDVGRYLSGEAISACPPGFIAGMVRLAKKHRAAAAALTGVFASLVAAVVGIGLFANRAEVARVRAEEKEAEATQQKELAEAHSRLAAEQRDRAAAHEAESRRQKELAETEQAKAVAEAEKTKKQLYLAQLSRLAGMLDSPSGVRPPAALTNSLKELVTEKPTAIELECLMARCDESLMLVCDVMCFAVMPDAAILVSGHRDGTVRLWDMPTGFQKESLQGDGQAVRAVAVHSDQRIVSVSADGQLRLWKRADGRFQSHSVHPAGKTQAVAYSPDGQFVVTGGSDQKVRVWDGVTGQLQKTVAVPFEVGQLHVACRGARVCIVPSVPDTYGPGGLKWKAIGVLDLASDKPLVTLTFEGNKWPYALWRHAVAISPDGGEVAVGGEIYSAATGERVRELDGGGDAVHYSPDGRLLAIQKDGRVHVWDMPANSSVASFEATGAMAFSRDGLRIVTGSVEGVVRTWESTTGKLAAVYRGNFYGVDDVHALYCDSAERFIVSNTLNKRLRWWSSTDRPDVVRWQPQGSIPCAIAFSPDGTLFATAGKQGIALWDSDTCLHVGTLGTDNRSVGSIAFHPDGNKLLAAGSGVSICDIPTGTHVFDKANPLKGSASSCGFTRDRVLVACHGDAAWLWSLPSGREVIPSAPQNAFVLSDGTPAACICTTCSPDGRSVASYFNRVGLVVRDAATNALRWQDAKAPYCKELCFSSDGMTVAASTVASREAIAIWDVASGRRKATLKEELVGRVSSIALDTSGERVVAWTGSTVRFWDARDGIELVGMPVGGRIRKLVLSPDNAILISGDEQGTLRVWGRSNAEILARRRSHLETRLRLSPTVDQWLRSNAEEAIQRLEQMKKECAPLEYRVARNYLLGQLCPPQRPSPSQ